MAYHVRAERYIAPHLPVRTGYGTARGARYVLYPFFSFLFIYLQQGSAIFGFTLRSPYALPRFSMSRILRDPQRQ